MLNVLDSGRGHRELFGVHLTSEFADSSHSVGVDLAAPEAEKVGEVGLNLQCKKIPGGVLLFWAFLKCCRDSDRVGGT